MVHIVKLAPVGKLERDAWAAEAILVRALAKAGKARADELVLGVAEQAQVPRPGRLALVHGAVPQLRDDVRFRQGCRRQRE